MVVFSTDEIASSVVRKGECVGACLDLCDPELYSRFFHPIECKFRLTGIVKRQQKKRLNTEAVVTERPRSHCLSDDSDFVSIFFFQDFNRFKDTLGIWMCQEIVRNCDVINILPDGFTHLNSGPVVLLLPLDFAPQRTRFLDD